MKQDERLSVREKLYTIDWEGPFTLEELKNPESVESELDKSACLYAIHSHHPIYGPNSLTYIGMTLMPNISDRLTQHKWWDETVLVGTLYNFKSWDSYNSEGYDDCVKKTAENKSIIEAVEALLIYSLAPAYNSRNKKSAELSKRIRVFNTSDMGSIPVEVSGFYNIEKGPDPEEVDAQTDKN